MNKLPQITPKVLLKFFLKNGFSIRRQVGSHIRLIHSDGRRITVAIHNRPIAPGTFQAILKQANLNRNEFLESFKKR